MNVNGTSSVVMKRFTFIKHHFLTKKPSPEVLQAISTRVILWGQAVRTCIVRRRRPKQKAVWLKYKFPRVPGSVARSSGGTGMTTAAASGGVSTSSDEEEEDNTGHDSDTTIGSNDTGKG